MPCEIMSSDSTTLQAEALGHASNLDSVSLADV
jgi:hypothetical protein